MPLPWVQIIKLAPTILSLANDLRQRARRMEELPEQEDPALREMKNELRQQAELLHALARQMEGLTLALTTLRRSLMLALGLGGCALLLAIGALLLLILR